ncbi:DUF547 domain-containing protein [Thalassospira sp.]|uniref:DUF547 domain-containing protein n=1 Tax=Thalassospira sp. TaxID=1912094 RepID=UPI0027366D5C|nr:DUF547 domain-containing protein [Thalassospira sp.]MDP2700171.1 DUF547 domain-containing protein [Thalassospira sp.]
MLSRLILILLPVLIAFPIIAQAAPRADLWPDWQAHDATNDGVINHDRWQAVLDRHVIPQESGATAFDYIAAQRQSRGAIAAYIDDMAAIAIGTHNRGEQMAYWINLYNAVTVLVVLDSYPVHSIRDIDISPGLFSSGPWGKKLVTVEGRSLSLDDIEHRILRPIWRDARIHYAVNCASVGCPALAQKVFTGGDLDRQLDAAATGFINHPRAVRLNKDGTALILSRLYDWYRDDFGRSDRDLIAHLRSFARPELRAILMQFKGGLRVSDYQYDWALNDHP